jgi:hypothetical protein
MKFAAGAAVVTMITLLPCWVFAQQGPPQRAHDLFNIIADMLKLAAVYFAATRRKLDRRRGSEDEGSSPILRDLLPARRPTYWSPS